MSVNHRRAVDNDKQVRIGAAELHDLDAGRNDLQVSKLCDAHDVFIRKAGNEVVLFEDVEIDLHGFEILPLHLNTRVKRLGAIAVDFRTMKVVIGVDAGGSKTRALAVTSEGDIVGRGEGGGGNPGHDQAYLENIHGAIRRAAETAGYGNVVRVVAGIAGLDRPEDMEWAAGCTRPSGICCPQVQINDADIALFGAFGGAPGIVSIQGDGSMIFGKSASGRSIRNFDFRHYARAAGPWIGSNATLLLLARGIERGDEDLAESIWKYWGVDSMESLRELASRFNGLAHENHLRRHGDMASLVTQAAGLGSPLATKVCKDAAQQVVDGIRLVGRMFEHSDVSVALIGSCVRSSYLRSEVERLLLEAQERRYRVVDPIYSPVVGAALMALAQEGIALTPEALQALAEAS